MLGLRIFISVVFLVILIYLLIDNRVESKMFREVLAIAGRSIEKHEELLNDLNTVLERCKKVEQENDILRSIITTTNACDEYLRQQEEDGNI